MKSWLLPWLAGVQLLSANMDVFTTTGVPYLLPLDGRLRRLVPGIAGICACCLAAHEGLEQRPHNGQRVDVFATQTPPLDLPQVHARNDGSNGYEIGGVDFVAAWCIMLRVHAAAVLRANGLCDATAFHFDSMRMHFI